MQKTLLIFVKNAVLGKVKTRLAATVGNTVALKVYHQLLNFTAKCTINVFAKKIVFYSTKIETDDIWDETIFDKKLQSGNDLGDRMLNAFNFAFNNESDHVAIIGSDCFEITPQIIDEAFLQLKNYDVVIGPALDGGYYLLAIKQPQLLLFKEIKWSTEEVYQQTIKICNKLNLSVFNLKELADIDNEEDLKRIGFDYKNL